MTLSQVLFLFLLISTTSWGATDIPRNLNHPDRVRALEILGFGSAAKILDNPYPLGGYTGIEMGVTSEFIPLEDLSGLGNGTNDRGELNYYTLTFGKGLFYNIDTLVYFTPFVQSEKVSNFGAQIRWGFYEASFFPIAFSTILYGGGVNYSNLINATTIGLDLVATVTMDNVALYFGGGKIRAIGQFIGGVDGVTDSGTTEQEDILDSHVVFGINVDIQKFFVALEIDRYADSMYSGKVGLRF